MREEETEVWQGCSQAPNWKVVKPESEIQTDHGQPALESALNDHTLQL